MLLDSWEGCLVKNKLAFSPLPRIIIFQKSNLASLLVDGNNDSIIIVTTIMKQKVEALYLKNIRPIHNRCHKLEQKQILITNVVFRVKETSIST